MPRTNGRSNSGRLFVAKSSFSVDLGGVSTPIQKGDLVDEGDPVLKGRHHMFDEFVPKPRRYAGQVEQATAAPGEKRG